MWFLSAEAVAGGKETRCIEETKGRGEDGTGRGSC
jgi:hypothetical protein